jgi:hypothetical protein
MLDPPAVWPLVSVSTENGFGAYNAQRDVEKHPFLFLFILQTPAENAIKKTQP